MKDKYVEALLKAPNSVLIGSRAFGVASEDSDTNIAIHTPNLPTLMRKINAGNRWTAKRYFNVLPLNNCGIIRLAGLDVLLYDELKDLNTVKNCVELMKYISTEILEVKSLRIRIFETLLVNRGFIDTRQAENPSEPKCFGVDPAKAPDWSADPLGAPTSEEEFERLYECKFDADKDQKAIKHNQFKEPHAEEVLNTLTKQEDYNRKMQAFDQLKYFIKNKILPDSTT